MDHPEIGMALLRKVAEALVDDAALESTPRFESRRMLSDGADANNTPQLPGSKGQNVNRRKSVPKLKTHKGAKRRFRITGTGKLVRMKGHRSHLRRKKTARAKRLFCQEDRGEPVRRQDAEASASIRASLTARISSPA